MLSLCTCEISHRFWWTAYFYLRCQLPKNQSHFSVRIVRDERDEPGFLVGFFFGGDGDGVDVFPVMLSGGLVRPNTVVVSCNEYTNLCK